MLEYRPFDLCEYKTDCAVITDENVAKLFNISGENVFVLPCGRAAKSFEWLYRICEFLAKLNLNKNSRLVAVGGGSVGDVAGFAASIFKRGIKLINYPTTLLAMIDSAIGGKTAIDLLGAKNVVGTYYFGDTVIDTNFLKTLPAEQYSNAWGEVIKYTLLDKKIDKEAFVSLSTKQNFTEKLIKLCAEYKLKLTNKHKTDDSTRKKLNLGHTFGHAIEAYFNIEHGVAVANGLYYELLLADKLFGLDKAFLDQKIEQLRAIFDIIKIDDFKPLISLLLMDKKNEYGEICFVLPKGSYKTEEIMLTPDQLVELMPL